MTQNAVKNTKRRMAVNVCADQVMVYMERSAIRELIAKLEKVADADPGECLEVHMVSHFSFFDGDDDNGSWNHPRVSFSDGLGPIISQIRDRGLSEGVASGEFGDDATLAPFEVTIMHVSQDAVEEESARTDD